MAEEMERNPLFSVEFVHLVVGQGLTILCCFPDPKQERIQIGDPIEFVRPDGSILKTTVRAISMVMDARPGLIGIVLPKGIQTDDIPRGSKLRLVRSGGSEGNERQKENWFQEMLTIKNLHARVEDKEILRGINLTVKAGEIHAIMGENGSGKSTLAGVLAGRDAYEVTAGEVRFEGKDLLELDPEERAREGIFLAFQYPVEIPGVSNTYFLKAAVNAVRKYRGQPEYDAREFLKLVKEKTKLLHISEELLKRPVNEGFSGGEKKRNEIFQMAVLDPKLAILDETDSGLDIDALKAVADGVNALRRPDRAVIVITHYQRLLNYIVPDYVHVLMRGRIVKSGGKELALELEEKGYKWLEDSAA
jgi:Fe-S cluster assembly ATP-binding protein